MSGKSVTAWALFEACRPKQWIKNGFVLAPLVFGQRLSEWDALAHSALAFVLFCAYSSSVYLLNDVADVERDRLHPEKRNRPLPSGRLTTRAALTAAAVLAGVAALFSLSILGAAFFRVGLAYLLLNLAYSWRLKRVVILDGLCIATGFVLRTIAGAISIAGENSDWLYLCTVLLSLLLAFSKRRHEVALLEGAASDHRRILAEYPLPFLDQIIAVVTGATVVCYSLYTLDVRTIEHFGSDGLKFTIPFVLYGLLRYLFLVYRCEKGGNPTELVLSDRPLMLTVIGWLLVSVSAVYGWEFWRVW